MARRPAGPGVARAAGAAALLSGHRDWHWLSGVRTGRVAFTDSGSCQCPKVVALVSCMTCGGPGFRPSTSTSPSRSLGEVGAGLCSANGPIVTFVATGNKGWQDSGQQGRTVSLHGADSLKADLSEDRIIKCGDSSVLKYLEYSNDRPGHH